MKHKDLESLTTRYRLRWLCQRLLLMVIMGFLFFSCRQTDGSDAAVVSGVFPPGASGKILLSELTPEKVIGIDSTVVAPGETFLLKVYPAGIGLYLLHYDDKNQKLALVIDKGDTLLLTADTNGFYKISGNADSQLLMQYANAARELRLSLDSLGTIVLASRSKDDFVGIKTDTDRYVDSAMAAHRKFVERLILQHPSSLASLLLVNTYFAGNLLLPIDSFPNLYRIIADSAGAHYPGNAHVLHHISRVESAEQQCEQEQMLAERLLPGRKLPEFSLPDENGNLVTASSFKNQPIILFLWASWSPESRAAIQQLKALTIDIPILAISFDSDSQIWKAAVKIENTSWTHINDSQGMSGAAAKLFGASRHLPYYILADSSSTIIASTSRFRELTEALDKLK